ncbi:uncharacterized protein NMK_1669 [Novimethylophilus kurashikiensis]|uniref:Low-complexity protein n=1 Tax=Novimethylophilus kurashikiensis TaxID=1825523 RepID=A0A2R5F8H1_9PROT|nr:hypothetical protein [Novimethylophilus kurashikiensis]GBG14109.1 uncharacterized protein NMK_1669 [Novimethylophilus kurashikiensis]
MKVQKKMVAVALGGAVAASLSMAPVAQAEQNPFSMQPLAHGYMVADAEKAMDSADGKMKDGKCSTGKCGSSKKKAMKEKQAEADAKAKEGNCSADKKMKDGNCSSDMKH